MALYELKTGITLAAIERIEDLLAEFEEQRLMVLEDKPTAQAWLVGYFETKDEADAAWKRLAEAGDAEWNTAQPELRELPDTDWKNSYKAHFKASKFGRLNWVPVWEREQFQLPPGEEVLWLDPGMAFGTGNHETTRLCCERLALYATRAGNSGRVIDAGCGSGILALSAAKLGFKKISGFDNDPEAIRVSQENAVLNDLTGCVEFYVGDLVTGLAGRQAELVMANIQSDVLMRFVNELCGAVAAGGELVLSGILSRELDEVRAKFSEQAVGWKIESRVLGEWADLSLVRV
jgi:ribosomal protein L11 methyltransferase